MGFPHLYFGEIKIVECLGPPMRESKRARGENSDANITVLIGRKNYWSKT